VPNLASAATSGQRSAAQNEQYSAPTKSTTGTVAPPSRARSTSAAATAAGGAIGTVGDSTPTRS